MRSWWGWEGVRKLMLLAKKHFEITLRLNSLYSGMAAKENKS